MPYISVLQLCFQGQSLIKRDPKYLILSHSSNLRHHGLSLYFFNLKGKVGGGKYWVICHMKGAALCGISELKRIKKTWACYNLSECWIWIRKEGTQRGGQPPWETAYILWTHWVQVHVKDNESQNFTLEEQTFTNPKLVLDIVSIRAPAPTKTITTPFKVFLHADPNTCPPSTLQPYSPSSMLWEASGTWDNPVVSLVSVQVMKKISAPLQLSKHSQIPATKSLPQKLKQKNFN